MIHQLIFLVKEGTRNTSANDVLLIIWQTSIGVSEFTWFCYHHLLKFMTVWKFCSVFGWLQQSFNSFYHEWWHNIFTVENKLTTTPPILWSRPTLDWWGHPSFSYFWNTPVAFQLPLSICRENETKPLPKLNSNLEQIILRWENFFRWKILDENLFNSI